MKREKNQRGYRLTTIHVSRNTIHKYAVKIEFQTKLNPTFLTQLAESGIGPVSRFDSSELRTHIAAEVRNFDPNNYMDRKEARRLDLYIQYAMAAAKEAMADAKLDMANEDPSRVGVIFGSAMGGM